MTPSLPYIGGRYNQLLQTGFLREAITTSLIPLDTILPEICAFIIGFNCTVWINVRSLTGSLADGVLADAILIPPRPPMIIIRKKRLFLAGARN